MLALQIALELDVSAMEEMKTPVMEKLDPGGKGVMTRKAWKIISTEWQAGLVQVLPGLCEDNHTAWEKPPVTATEVAAKPGGHAVTEEE